MTNTGKIGIYFLEEIWQYYQHQKYDHNSAPAVEWTYINGVFNTLGIGLEPTVRYLLNTSQCFEDFEEWILENGRVSQQMIAHFNAIVTKEQSDTFTPKKIFDEVVLKDWNEKGFVTLKGALSKEDCQSTVDLICNTIDVDLNDPSTWYNNHSLKKGIMIQLFNAPILEKNRFSPKIKAAFEQLWNKDNLLASMDRVSFNPPETPNYTFQGPNLHWDVSLKLPIPFGLQGLVYLADTAADQGAFTVIPGFHRHIDNWLTTIEKHPRSINLLHHFDEHPIAGEAGDLIIWNHCLPHGSRPNHHALPRFVQYINYQPIDMTYQEEWI